MWRCFSGTHASVFHRDTCHREFHQRNSRDKCLLREACFDGGDVTVKKNSVTLNEERGGRWEDRKFNAAWCFSGAHATVRFTKETFVTSSCRVKRCHLGVVKVERHCDLE